jgi:hypothetical protein
MKGKYKCGIYSIMAKTGKRRGSTRGRRATQKKLPPVQSVQMSPGTLTWIEFVTVIHKKHKDGNNKNGQKWMLKDSMVEAKKHWKKAKK